MDATQLTRLENIARGHLHIETLETQRSDSLDFHDVSVWGVRAALEAAFNAGAEQARREAANKTTIDLGNNEERSKGVYPQADGTYMALGLSVSKSGFKTYKGAASWLTRKTGWVAP